MDPITLGAIGLGLSGGGSLLNAFFGREAAQKQLEEMKRQNKMLERQYNIENARYDKREGERDAANSYFQDMGADFYNKYYKDDTSSLGAPSAPYPNPNPSTIATRD